jgi:cobyrinic acid a,c-diamide synthase
MAQVMISAAHKASGKTSVSAGIAGASAPAGQTSRR